MLCFICSLIIDAEFVASNLQSQFKLLQSIDPIVKTPSLSIPAYSSQECSIKHTVTSPFLLSCARCHS